MKKLALTSLLAMFAISSANAATNYFVGGAASIETDNDHYTLVSVAPEFGWKLNEKWDLGVMAGFEYDRDYDIERSYAIGGFARYNVAQFGDFKLLLKGAVAAGFFHEDGETANSLYAEINPMVTYDISESFTLYANLKFLGASASYVWANDKMGVEKGWEFKAGADTDYVLNTEDFQIGFTYNF